MSKLDALTNFQTIEHSMIAWRLNRLTRDLDTDGGTQQYIGNKLFLSVVLYMAIFRTMILLQNWHQFLKMAMKTISVPAACIT